VKAGRVDSSDTTKTESTIATNTARASRAPATVTKLAGNRRGAGVKASINSISSALGWGGGRSRASNTLKGYAAAAFTARPTSARSSVYSGE
jgi:hypothetical protein